MSLDGLKLVICEDCGCAVGRDWQDVHELVCPGKDRGDGETDDDALNR